MTEEIGISSLMCISQPGKLCCYIRKLNFVLHLFQFWKVSVNLSSKWSLS